MKGRINVIYVRKVLIKCQIWCAIRLIHIRKKECILALDADKCLINAFLFELTKNTYMESNIPLEKLTLTTSNFLFINPFFCFSNYSFLNIVFTYRKNIRVIQLQNEDKNGDQFSNSGKQLPANRNPLQRLKITKTYITERGVVTEKVNFILKIDLNFKKIVKLKSSIFFAEYVCRHRYRSHKNESHGNCKTEWSDSLCTLQAVLGNSSPSQG